MEKMMTTRLSLLIAVAVVSLGLAAPVSAAGSPPRPGVGTPSVPANLEVPPGHVLFLEGHAVGTQNYVCLPSSTGVAWRFLGPQATLFLTRHGDLHQQVTTHFLSANPAEQGTPRPTWQHSLDTSQVWGRVVASSTDLNYVAPGAIPWLLVESAGTATGPGGGALLAQTTFIHRVNTSGGVAPSTGCTHTGEIGAVALVPYRTDYFFYRASRRR
jgi:hypothetical protein